MNNTTKIRTICIVLLLLTAVVAFVPQTMARPQYAAALNTVYGDGSCTNCHNDPNGGKSFTDYGLKFKSQSVYKTDPATALKAIGAPPGSVATTVSPTVTVTTSVATETPTVTDAAPVATVTETVPVATVTDATLATNETSGMTAVPTVNKESKRETEEKGEEQSEKEETSEKSPGIGIVAVIGIIGTIYVMRKRR